MTEPSLPEESIFLQALEIQSAAERAAYLDHACGPNQELRAVVEALLRAHQKSGDLLDLPEKPVPTVDEAPATDSPGTVIGPYKLLEQSGEGGMGTVWMAQQTEPIKRLVAVKLIKAGMDSKQVIARFEAERQALALMDHPNIAKVLDAGTVGQTFLSAGRQECLPHEKGVRSVLRPTQDVVLAEEPGPKNRSDTFFAGRPYFVMELVRGVPITKYCDEHRLTPRQRLELFIPVCQAVQHAHQKGIIHRDLKPSNVLVGGADIPVGRADGRQECLPHGTPVPKVIDFGVAKATGQQLTDKTLVTGFGNIVGTLEYMSPEQAEVNQLDIDTRSDIYSLGVLLYELLAGSPPFTRKDLEKAGMLEMLRVIREQEPSKPSTKLSTAEGLPTLAANRGTEPAKLTRLVRGELDWIVMKALEKDRNRRYETVNGFAMDVQRYLADEAVQACPPSVGYRLRKFVRRKKWALGSAAVIAFAVLLAVGGIAGGVGWAARDRGARHLILNSKALQALEEAELALKRDQLAEAFAAVKQAEGLLSGAAGSDELQGRVHQWRADLDLLIRLRDARMVEQGEDVGRSGLVWAIPKYEAALRECGIDPGATPVEQAAEWICRRPPTVQVALLAALDQWADFGWLFGKKTDANPQKQAWVRAVLRAADPDPWRTRIREAGERIDVKTLVDLAESAEVSNQAPYTLDRLAGMLCSDTCGKKEAGIALSRRAQKLYPGDYEINLSLGARLLSAQPPQPAEGVRFCSIAASLRPDSSRALNNLGWGLRRIGRLEEAIYYHRKAIELAPKNALAHQNLGSALIEQGRLDDAVVELRTAVELLPDNADTHGSLARVHFLRGKSDEAIRELKEAIRLEDHPRFRVNLGHVFASQRKFEQAIAEYRKVIALKPEEPELLDAYSALGTALVQKGAFDEAIAEMVQGIRLKPDHPGCHHNLGVALASKGRLEEAIAEFKEAIRLKGDAPVVHFDLGLLFQKQGRLDEAVVEYRKAIELKPDFAVPYNNLGNVFFQQGKLDDAISAYRKAVDLAPIDAISRMSLGNGLSARRRFDEAIVQYRKAIELNPRLEPAHFNLGLSLKERGDFDQAITVLRAAIQLRPDHANARSQLAWLLATCPNPKLRDPRQAVEHAKIAVVHAPREGSFWNTLGVAHYRAGDWQAAMAALQKSMELSKEGNSSDWFYVAMAHWRQHDKDQARKWFDRAVQWMEQNQPNNEALRSLRAEAEDLLAIANRKN